MRKLILFGVLLFAAKLSLATLAKDASYPVRHPHKTLHALYKAVV